MQENPSTIKKPKVLVVDGSAAVCERFYAFLKQRGYACHAVRDAQQALAAIEMSQYDMVFLDVVMPEMDGYTACGKIKAMPSYKHVPVVLLTSRESTADRVYGAMVGCSRYLTKSPNAGELDELLSNLCPLPGAGGASKAPDPSRPAAFSG